MSYTATSACCAARTCEYRDGPPAKSKHPADDGTTCAWDFLESKLLARSWLGCGQPAQHIWHSSGLLRRCCSCCSEHVGSSCVIGLWGDPHSTRCSPICPHTGTTRPKSPHTCSSDGFGCAGGCPGAQTNGRTPKVCPDLAHRQENISIQLSSDMRWLRKKHGFSHQQFTAELCFLSSPHMKGYNLLWLFLRSLYLICAGARLR